MIKLTQKEEFAMDLFWEKGPLFVKELMDFYEEPKPHINTLSSVVRSLEEKGLLTDEAFGGSFRYSPAMTREEFGQQTFKGVIGKYFDNSYLRAVSALVKEEDISIDELKKLIKMVEKGSL